jgi:uncharacterized protein YceK
VRLRGLALLSLCAALAGCGGTAKHASAPQTESVQTAEVQADQPRKCDGGSKAKQAAQRRRLDRDLRRLRAAAVTMKHYAQDGNAATNTALDRFMLDIGDESLSAVARNRYIDRAAAIVSSHCYLCFQTLEYNRPLAAGAKLACG